MLSLRLLGGLDLAGPQGRVTGRAAQRRRLALLAVLAVARGRPVTRDKLVALLWPDVDTERARHGLADSVYVLRDALGEDVILVTGDVLSLYGERITSDVMEFEDAIERGDSARAASLYEAGGPFLDGVHLSGAGELERWIESVRDRLAGSYREVLEALANEAPVRGDYGGAVVWWRKLAAEDRLSSRVALGLMRALAAAGDSAGALEFARVHESVVRIELESAPDAAVTTFAGELRASRTSAPPGRVAETPAPARLVSPLPDENAGGALLDRSVSPLSQATIAEPRRDRAPRALWFAPLVLAVPLAIYGMMRAPQPAVDAPGATTRAVPSIAVLPLINLSADPKNESFVDGMTEELNTALTRIDGLSVGSNTSAMAFKGHRTDVRKIGESLHVSYVLEGGLQLVDGQIRLNVSLVDAASGKTRWSEKYDRTMSDVFAVQDDIGRSVAEALELRLLNVGRSGHLLRHMTSDPVAYELYVRGRDQTLYRTDSGAHAAVDYFSHAIARDSTFAAAYAGLAHAYRWLAGTGGTPALPRRMLIDKADKAARKAVSLDDSLAEGHTFLAYVKLTTQDLRGASKEVNRALELDPHDLFARTLLAVLYIWSGRHEDAVAEDRRVLDAEPSPLARIDLAEALFFAGHDDEALAELQPLREVRPPLRRTPQIAGEIYLHKKMWEQAVHELRSQTDPGLAGHAVLGLALGEAGDRAGAMRILEELKGRAGTTGAFPVAVVYVGLGDYDQACAWFDKSIDDHSMTRIIMDPTFAQLRKDPCFARIRQRLGVDGIQLR